MIGNIACVTNVKVTMNSWNFLFPLNVYRVVICIFLYVGCGKKYLKISDVKHHCRHSIDTYWKTQPLRGGWQGRRQETSLLRVHFLWLHWEALCSQLDNRGLPHSPPLSPCLILVSLFLGRLYTSLRHSPMSCFWSSWSEGSRCLGPLKASSSTCTLTSLGSPTHR